ncbi:MAG TPA: DEAD/DEAH box helicase [Candidatus Caccovicinus merdipullorum]|uniref:DEAD/DEAH box helicase n=1 Tax=Candidatus Caccovicinus merdipullorum TaxID=2840724 RepID=A0A9D1GIY9_9FIRM|nr:DEAD/DEAH box helicase [Candidatus Caccovicinus merdipullorum]
MKIRELTVNTFWKGEVGVRGLVEDNGKEYRVQLYGKGSAVRDYSCSCPEGNSWRGMCPHAKALWEAYQKKEKNQGGSGYGLVFTSQEVRTMIREYTNREVARIQLEGQEGAVRFLARLSISGGGKEIRAEFKVGREKQYVIRDLTAFAQAMNHGTYVEYGKNFAFYHSLDAFTPESRPLVEFVVELVNVYRDYYAQFRRTSFDSHPPLRELNLSRENRDRFFAIVAGQTLEVENGLKGKRSLQVCSQNPRFYVQVQRQGRDGLSVSFDPKSFLFFGEKCLYVGDEERIYCCDEECSRVMGVFAAQMSQSVKHTVTVNQKDIPLLYERVLRRIEPYCVFQDEEINWEEYRSEPLKAEFRFTSEEPGEITMEPVLSYGEYTFHPIEDETLPRTVCRDVPGEFRISQLIARYFRYKEPEGKKLVIRGDDEAMFRLMESGMAEFAQLGNILVDDSVRHMRILPPLSVRTSVSMNGGWLDIRLDMDGLTASDLEQILKAYQGKKKFYRLKSGEFLKLQDDGLLAVARLGEGLDLDSKKLASGHLSLPGYRAFYLDSLFKEGPGITFYRDQLFKAVVRGMKAVEDSDFAVPSCLQTVLRGYQKLGFRWLRTLDSYGFGGILADDMGLGKTVQMIALFVDEYASGKDAGTKERSLIVCPASLVYNWENEFQKFAPMLKVQAVAGTAQEREEVFASLDEGCQVLITSYDLLKRDMKHYESMSFRFQVIDEAQYIKNAATQSARAVKAIRARTRFALTGTPIENRLGELWSIFDYLMPGFLFTYAHFKKIYESPIVRESDPEAVSNLKRLIGPFVLRRVKKDVLKELPDKLETAVYSRLQGQQKELYTANAAKLKEELESGGDAVYEKGKIQILAELTRLRQICCDPALCYENYRGGSAKLETCMDLIRNGVNGGHKILLFSQFTSMLRIIEKRLSQEEIACYTLTGSTPKEERLRMVDSFHTDPVPVFLISLKAGGTGLNLTAADMVIHYDPWWNVAAQNQATDRAHRIGQEKQVSVFKLITKGTIEENIMVLQESKKNLADQIIAEGAVSLSSLTREDLVKMLTPE